jgi:hypothetical protein
MYFNYELKNIEQYKNSEQTTSFVNFTWSKTMFWVVQAPGINSKTWLIGNSWDQKKFFFYYGEPL